MNESTTAGGHYLGSSNIACAVAAMVTSTKKITDVNVKDSMISKVVIQYSHKGKPYSSIEYEVFAKYALGGVPPGMDSKTLIETYNNIQASNVSARAAMKAVKQSEKVTTVLS